MVDMWFMALCLAVKEKIKPDFDHKGPTYKAINGDVFGSDLWRSNALMLLAIAGLPRLIAILEERGGDTALDYLSDVIEDMLDD
ncbi:hypothetical protein SFOMI_0686 [Sphingobium fuliginis]|uniref:Uncharacterized protein n=2 Tax=Sphingobium fuliginis (strain ATCC 27551) TaxID=336203 RepID=A0A292ZBE7_SPHSA|nr:hypothetical protein SFOMI_0686 [Sphingobium fuliginis]